MADTPSTNEPADAGSVRRRSLLRGSFIGGALAVAAAQAGCSANATDGRARASAADAGTPGLGATAAPSTASRPRPELLVAYFSRPGENYHYGGRRDLRVGNTEVVARLISERLRCDLHRIEAADPYSRSYDETVARNVREQDADARPAIANPLGSLEDYDLVLLGSPIWNVRPPMIMHTFAESHDFTGKTVHPFTTHAMSGLGTTEREYAIACRGATLGEGLAVQGEEVGTAERAVTAWLSRINLHQGTP